MKKAIRISVLACIITLTLSTNVKSQKGIYLTASDFAGKQLSYNASSKIRINNSLIEMPYVTIVDHGSKKILKKEAIYGYKNKDGNVYRFFNNSEYQIVEAGNIYIYLQIEHVAQSKGFAAKKNYYFSTSASGKVIRLTFDNIRNTFRANGRFLDLLDQFFSDADVTVYDNIHNTFKINYVYTKALESE